VAQKNPETRRAEDHRKEQESQFEACEPKKEDV
jgi:hypothetical protein